MGPHILKSIIADQRKLFLKSEVGVIRKKTSEINNYLKTKLKKVYFIVGHRRSGKSTMLRQLVKNNHFAYFDFSDVRLTDLSKKDLNVIYEIFLAKDPRLELILFDEIQNAPEWNKYLNTLKEKYKIVVTGSNSSLLTKDLNTFLTGRHIDFEIYPFSFIEYLDFFKQLGASALTDKNIEVPTDGVEEGVPVTYVPFRNGIFLSMAAAIAEKEGASVISIGVVEEDSSGYPDCREEYISAMQKAINLGTKDETNIEIRMPLVHLKKSEIVQTALEYNVPLELTWSCYKNEQKACGVCDSCRLRLNGFALAGVEDPIPYE
jgi:7-cyano-7-deazaguanine synthase